jgi:hypothetical protein
VRDGSGVRRQADWYWSRLAAAVAGLFLVVNLVALGGIWQTLSRAPTGADLKHAADVEVARRWQTWPAGQIFPDRIPYSVVGETEYASRVGIAPNPDCEAAVDPALAPILSREHCRAVLRATYLDQMQGVVVTLGVAAFPDEQAAYRARAALVSGPDWLKAFSPAGTAAARFRDAARQSGTAERAGPYVVFTTAGQPDGRPAASVPHPRTGVFEGVPQLGHAVAAALAAPAVPDCKSRNWQC